ncbi:MAG TPA: DUF4038 domain-containing protein, partial [Thermoanaerobaculia bacterium]|nr:DUF4038 domain-containing protein [Thermoanaerobaculia bacterium]
MLLAMGSEKRGGTTMLPGSLRRSVWWFLMILAAVGAARVDAQCGGGSSIGQYGCWEQQIESSKDFYNGGAGNPYRDLTLRVTFTGPGTGTGGTSFTQDAFWVGDTTNATTAKRFKVRAALRPGIWTWSIAGCTGTTGNQSCSTGTTWTPSSGAIMVYARALPNALLSRGFPTQSSSGTVYQPLTYGDRVTRFYWAGDTAWSAPAFEIDALLHGGARYWSNFLAARTPDSQFWPPPPYNHYAASAVLVAPAAHWNKANAADVFKVQPGCPLTPAMGSNAYNNVLWYPNNCSIPNPAYWDALDTMVQSATNSDIVLLIAGLIHPLNLGSTYPTYPPPAEVARFSRYLAARMAGFAVMFSPGFDMPVTALAADGTSNGRMLMDSSGTAVRAASPKALVTAHLNGSALCSDYRSFATSPSPWMTWYLFQSGHALASQGQSSDPCAGWQGLAQETRVQGALRRAINLPATLAGYSSPTMPSINAEGPYDNPANSSTDYTLVDVRYRVRQAGNLSSLSGAQGFTYGMTPVSLWSNPSAIGTRPSETDMHALATRFRPYPGLA